MKNKILNKAKKIKEIVSRNRKKLEITFLVFLIAIAISIFSFSPLRKNISGFILKKACLKSAQNIPDDSLGEEYIEDNSVKKMPDLVIGAMADLHAESRTYEMISTFTKKVQERLEEEGKADFIIELGDFIENRNKYGKGMKKQPREEGLAEWKKADSSFLGYTPRYHVVGNHEMFSFFKNDYEELIGLNSYYSFLVKGYQIIVLDSNYNLFSGRDVELNNEEEGAYAGAIPKEEMQWLEERLKEEDKNIIFVHHPLYSVKKSVEIENLLKKYNKKIVLIASGHKHKTRSLTFAGIDYIDMPSLELQKQYAIISIKGKKSEVEFLNLQ
ncbi:MAG TPA: metallophosphoesterase [Candidatus Moranbacteria bacterium]|nr:metallophosphoesterase [Candidatus Moranbacteria bacterium]